METVYDLFLQALNASLKNEKVTWEQEMSPEESVFPDNGVFCR